MTAFLSLDPLSRRGLFAGAGAAAVVAASRSRAFAGPEDFSFLFITDTHIQPELDAASGVSACFRRARSVGADFAIQGGDHIFDALGVPAARANALVALYKNTEHDLGMAVHHTVGNHDCFGVYARSGVAPSDPEYGKKFFEDHFGRLYYSFDHRGVHFVVLDSIGITAVREYEGRVDGDQIAWLGRDLAGLAPGTPVVVVSHIPLVTAFDSYVPASMPPVPAGKTRVLNATDVVATFAGHNVLGVLQGHTHINETVVWRGVKFITSGAVCGNWWHGTRMGVPEGFSVVTVRDGVLSVRYQTYGFRSVDPHNT